LIFGQTYANFGEELTWTWISVGVAWLAAILFWLGTRRLDARLPEHAS
jgi:hypothetical protein